MTVFESFKLKNIDELAEWINKYGVIGDCPWDKWWSENYCNKCKPEVVLDEDDYEREYAWCELNGKCRFFKEMNETPTNEQAIKMWLESEDCYQNAE